MIEAHDLTRKFGDFTAVAGVSFALSEGEIVGILGPNGAGKTTTIRMLTGFLPPSSGRVTLGGRDLFGGTPDAVAVRREIGYLPESVALYPEMRVEEYLSYRARLEGMDRTSTRRRLGEALERCLLSDVRRQVIGTLSKGYRQRVGLAGAMLHDPKVLILDEPTVGLDPKQIVAIRELIRELGRKHTLLLSTHILPEVELLCGRVLIFDRGRDRRRRQSRPAARAPPGPGRGDGRVRSRGRRHGGGAGADRRGARGPCGSRAQRPSGALRARVRARLRPARGGLPPGGRALLDAGRARLGARLARGHLRPPDDPRRGIDRGRARARRGGGMKGALAVFGRELRAYFFSPLAYVILTFFVLVQGYYFSMIVAFLTDPRASAGRPLELFFGQTIFTWLVLIFAGTFLTMRLISEELRSGTIETLMTSPISETQVVAGKYAAALTFYLFLWAPTLVYVAIVRWFTPVDWGPIAASYLGICRHRRPLPRGRRLRLGDLQEPDGRRGRDLLLPAGALQLRTAREPGERRDRPRKCSDR